MSPVGITHSTELCDRCDVAKTELFTLEGGGFIVSRDAEVRSRHIRVVRTATIAIVPGTNRKCLHGTSCSR
ncbi:hypothetical protein CgunFtcFv8_009644 [Champsocephalus gunnari]|uniref:Uncharacterized protein n=1 Tax=Champsocephalus gunnari TaxID=52237 RepID=A0AAN8C4S8_CHAGU|nr:hypothetical protein CgunFtcFv8_009644 [Champsocephalus gunnari]